MSAANFVCNARCKSCRYHDKTSGVVPTGLCDQILSTKHQRITLPDGTCGSYSKGKRQRVDDSDSIMPTHDRRRVAKKVSKPVKEKKYTGCGDRIKQARLDAGMNREAAAVQLHCNSQTLLNMENGTTHSISESRLMEMAKLYGTTFSALSGEEHPVDDAEVVFGVLDPNSTTLVPRIGVHKTEPLEEEVKPAEAEPAPLADVLKECIMAEEPAPEPEAESAEDKALEMFASLIKENRRLKAENNTLREKLSNIALEARV